MTMPLYFARMAVDAKEFGHRFVERLPFPLMFLVDQERLRISVGLGLDAFAYVKKFRGSSAVAVKGERRGLVAFWLNQLMIVR